MNVAVRSSRPYWDSTSGEAIAGCHRSRRRSVHRRRRARLRPRLLGRADEDACHRRRRELQPGIDFYSDAQGRVGQARALRSLAVTRNVKAVVVMIGADNYGFADIVTRCVTNWATSRSWWKNYCSDGNDMTSRFTSTRIATETTNVRNALLRVRDAMQRGLQDVAVHAPRADVLVGRAVRRQIR